MYACYVNLEWVKRVWWKLKFDEGKGQKMMEMQRIERLIVSRKKKIEKQETDWWWYDSLWAASLKSLGKRERCFVLLMAFGIEGITWHSSSSITTQCPNTIPAKFQTTLLIYVFFFWQEEMNWIKRDTLSLNLCISYCIIG